MASLWDAALVVKVTSLAVQRGLPIREALRGRRLNWSDLVVGVGVLVLVYVVVKLGESMTVNFTPGRAPVPISTDITKVPYYAARSLLRMFAALALSTVFTFAYGTAAARLRRAEKVLTSQAWNMTFSFYHSLKSQPVELDEAARMYRLTKWERFWKLDVPSSMIGLVWNMMMSMGGGWFFLTASEDYTVLGSRVRACRARCWVYQAANSMAPDGTAMRRMNGAALTDPARTSEAVPRSRAKPHTREISRLKSTKRALCQTASGAWRRA